MSVCLPGGAKDARVGLPYVAYLMKTRIFKLPLFKQLKCAFQNSSQNKHGKQNICLLYYYTRVAKKLFADYCQGKLNAILNL